MRFRLLLGSVAAASALCLGLLPAACSSSDDSGVTVPPAEAGSSSGSSGSSGTSGSSGSSGDAAVDAADASKMPTSTDCSLMNLTASDVTPTYVVYGAPDNIPPTQTGGTLSGNYTVTAAKVYLPSQIAFLSMGMDVMESGTINSWAVFKGSRYLLHLKVDLTIATNGQSLPIKSDETSQGGYTAAAEKLTFDYACDTTQPQKADYSYSDDGSGTATILVHTVTNYSGFMLDGYILLTATKS